MFKKESFNSETSVSHDNRWITEKIDHHRDFICTNVTDSKSCRKQYEIGMTSVTFRGKSISDIVEIAHTAGLSLIEWGADRHVPPGDAKAASEALARMEQYGLSCPSYGSYYRIGDNNPAVFQAICKTAKVLGAKTIRTWLGRMSSAALPEKERAALLSETRELAAVAAEHSLTLAFEFHGGTLNDNGKSSIEFLSDCGMDNIKTYWQPLAFGNSEENLLAVLPWLCTVHVFNWDTENRRYPLFQAKDVWEKYIKIIENANLPSCPFLLEFVPNDSEEQFFRDAKALREFFHQGTC